MKNLILFLIFATLPLAAQSRVCQNEPPSNTVAYCADLNAADSTTVRSLLDKATGITAARAEVERLTVELNAAKANATTAATLAAQAAAAVAELEKQLATAKALLEQLMQGSTPEPPPPPPPPPPVVNNGMPNTAYRNTYIPESPMGCTSDPLFHPETLASCSPFIPRPVPGLCGTYRDPAFGTEVKVIENTGYLNVYSTPTALSATGKYATLEGGGNAKIVETATCRTVFMHNTYQIANQQGHFWWHPTNDDVMFFGADTPSGHTIYRTTVSNPAVKVPVFASGVPYMFTGGTGDLTEDLWLVYAETARRPGGLTPAESAAARICTAPLDGSDRKVCMRAMDIPGFDPNILDFFLLSGIDDYTGKRYVMVQRSGAILSVDGSSMKYEYTPGERPDAVLFPDIGDGDGLCEAGERFCIGDYLNHADTFRLRMPDGKHRVGFISEGLEWREYPLPNGQKRYSRQTMLWWANSSETTFYSDATPVGRFAGNHFSCSKNGIRPRCVMSSMAGQTPFTTTLTEPLPATYPFFGELIVVEPQTDLSLKIYRVANSTAYPYLKTNDYYSFPRAGISADGSTIIWTTTMGEVPPVKVAIARVE